MIEFDNTPLDGPEYKDHEYWEETSMFDDHPTTKWVYGIECYERLYRCRVPASLTDEEIDQWIYDNLGRVKWLN